MWFELNQLSFLCVCKADRDERDVWKCVVFETTKYEFVLSKKFKFEFHFYSSEDRRN